MIGGQLSFFSAGARPARPDDIEGVLCGPGQLVRQGQLARVSVVVDAARVEPLTAAFLAAGLASDVADAPAGLFSVRTAFDEALTPLADGWTTGGAKRPPAGLTLDGARLRFWALAAGTAHPGGYMLALGQHEDLVWPAVGGALAAAGLAAVFVGHRADGPAYRITGVRRLERLRELVGDRPDDVPPERWP